MEVMAWIGGVLSIGLALLRGWDAWRGRTRLVVKVHLSMLACSGGVVMHEGEPLQHVIVSVVNAGPGPITISTCGGGLAPLNGGQHYGLWIKAEGPEQMPCELTHGRSMRFIYPIREQLLGEPVEIRVLDSLGRQWKASRRDLKALRDSLGRYIAEAADA